MYFLKLLRKALQDFRFGIREMLALIFQLPYLGALTLPSALSGRFWSNRMHNLKTATGVFFDVAKI